MIETFFFKLSSPPPPQEVEELKGKLDALRDREKTLLHQKPELHQNGLKTIAHDSSDENSPVSSPSPFHSSISSNESERVILNGDVAPSSPLRAHFRAYLPNNQRTMVSIFAFCVVFLVTKYVR